MIIPALPRTRISVASSRASRLESPQPSLEEIVIRTPQILVPPLPVYFKYCIMQIVALGQIHSEVGGPLYLATSAVYVCIRGVRLQTSRSCARADAGGVHDAGES